LWLAEGAIAVTRILLLRSAAGVELGRLLGICRVWLDILKVLLLWMLMLVLLVAVGIWICELWMG
jgi:hypothetical protein